MRYIILEFIIPSIKVLFYLLDHHAQAEYDDVVACLDKGVARNQYTFTIADQAADGSPLGQSQVFHFVFGDFCVFGYSEFRYVRIGKGQAFTFDTSASSIIW